MRRNVWMFSALLSAGVLIGCEDTDRAGVDAESPTAGDVERGVEQTGQGLESTAQRTGEAIESGAQRTGEAIESGAQRAGEAVEGTAQRAGEAVQGTAEETADDARAAGARMGEAAGQIDHQGVHNLLAETVEAGAKAGTFNDMIERFSEQDRSRFQNVDAQAIETSVRPFNDAWNSKFGEFDIDDPNAVFGQIARIERGSAAPTAGGQQEQTARVTIQNPSGQGSPATLNLVKDGGSWRIDVPDQLDQQALQNSLSQKMQTMSGNAQQWTDEVKAQQQVAYHVLSALAGSDGGQQPGAGQ